MDDRKLQYEILTHLNHEYPKNVRVDNIPENILPNFNRCMHYLFEHELIDGHLLEEMRKVDTFFTAKITAKGIDFLADDGGLGAILGVVTIKLHNDTIQSIIKEKIEASSLPKENKSRLIEAIKSAPSTAIAELVKRLTGLALDQGHDAMHIIQNLLL